jgi:hypothetical protein
MLHVRDVWILSFSGTHEQIEQASSQYGQVRISRAKGNASRVLSGYCILSNCSCERGNEHFHSSSLTQTPSSLVSLVASIQRATSSPCRRPSTRVLRFRDLACTVFEIDVFFINVQHPDKWECRRLLGEVVFQFRPHIALGRFAFPLNS